MNHAPANKIGNTYIVNKLISQWVTETYND